MRLVCRGCGHEVAPDSRLPFRCPSADELDDVDHVLVRRLDPGDGMPFPSGTPENPFIAFRSLLLSHRLWLDAGLADDDFIAMVESIDRAIASIDGTGFRTTPLIESDGIVFKDETGNVGASHKARHLMGILLHLRVAEHTGRIDPDRTRHPLAIASCGNAALAAAIVAAADRRPIEVFVPPGANPSIVNRLNDLGARVTPCPRDDRPGDPCYRAFREAIATGALPFCCQGPDNGLTLEGGQTLGYELAVQLAKADRSLDRIFIQVGGGALAAATIGALTEAHERGIVPALPRLCTVQTTGASPLARAHERLQASIERLGSLDAALEHAAGHRSDYMWPWESEPHSLAEGILDDETYDWLAIVEAMARTGGEALIVEEATLAEAHQRVRVRVGIDACPTGTSGFAGVLQQTSDGRIDPAAETIGVLITGGSRASV